MTTPISAPAPADDWLEGLLKQDANVHRDAYIDDAGFTARVTDVLPPPVRVPRWRAPVVAGLWVAAAVASMFALPGAMLEVGREAVRMVAVQSSTLPHLVALVAAAGALTYGAAALVLRHD